MIKDKYEQAMAICEDCMEYDLQAAKDCKEYDCVIWDCCHDKK
jgi:hypothetical protein